MGTRYCLSIAINIVCDYQMFKNFNIHSLYQFISYSNCLQVEYSDDQESILRSLLFLRARMFQS